MLAPDEPIAIIHDANGGVAEAYRSLRVSLSKNLMQGKKAYALVSAWPGDGKSMVCTNLAIVLAQLHLKVLLIDGDLRRPTVSRVFGAHEMTGISDDLENLPSKVNLGYATKYSNTFLLPKGLSEINPANLLNPDRLGHIFRELRREYDCIVIDTPPLSACADALVLAAQCDEAMLVVSPKGWDGEVEARYKRKLAEHGVELFGVVLNGSHGAESHGYGYGYGNYGNYGKGYGNYGSTKPTKPAKKNRPAKSGFRWPWSRPDQDDSELE